MAFFRTLDELKEHCKKERCVIGFSDNTEAYKKPHDIGRLHISNSIAILPMEGCDAESDGSPGELTKRRYIRFTESMAGLIWLEAVSVVEEGRASPAQLYLHKGNLAEFQRLVETIREGYLQRYGFQPLLIVQLTHSGRYSKPHGTPVPVLAAHNPVLDDKFKVPWDHPLISDEELEALEDQYVSAALLAKDAGFDGVDVKASHGYLLSELLSAFTRKGHYGGDYEGRTQFLKNAIYKTTEALGPDFIVTSRLNLYDAMEYPYGFGVQKNDASEVDITEPARLINDLAGMGVRIVSVTMGNPYHVPHINRPFDKGGYIPPEPPAKGVARLLNHTKALKKLAPQVKIVGAGYSWLRQFAAQAGAYELENSGADIIGFGREAFAYPEFGRDILEKGSLDKAKVCITCSKCSDIMRRQGSTGCVVRDSNIYVPIYRKYVQGV